MYGILNCEYSVTHIDIIDCQYILIPHHRTIKSFLTDTIYSVIFIWIDYVKRCSTHLWLPYSTQTYGILRSSPSHACKQRYNRRKWKRFSYSLNFFVRDVYYSYLLDTKCVMWPLCWTRLPALTAHCMRWICRWPKNSFDQFPVGM